LTLREVIKEAIEIGFEVKILEGYADETGKSTFVIQFHHRPSNVGSQLGYSQEFFLDEPEEKIASDLMAHIERLKIDIERNL
jgi:hypothetical protein